MITFKTHADLSKLSRENPAYPIIEELVRDLIDAYDTPEQPYLPDDYGYIVLIEPGDTERVLSEIWDDWTLLDIPWEGITRRDSFFLAIFLANNEFGLVFVLPDAEWVNGRLREVLLENLDP